MRDSIEKNSKTIKADSVVVDIGIETPIDPPQPAIVEDTNKETKEKALLAETNPGILTRQTNGPKKGKKNKQGRNKKHGT